MFCPLSGDVSHENDRGEEEPHEQGRDSNPTVMRQPAGLIAWGQECQVPVGPFLISYLFQVA